MSIRHRLCVLTLITAAGPLCAGTLIEGRDETGGAHRILIEGDWARMEYGEDSPPEFLLLNLKTNQAYTVDRVQKRVVDLSDVFGQTAPGPNKSPAKGTFKRKAGGPLIAGYLTERYELSAGKEVCGEHYVAPKTLESKDIRRFITAMQVFSQHQTSAQDNPVPDPCSAAEDLADGEYANLGLPLRVTDDVGNVEHEVRKISLDVKFPAGTFDMPAGYAMTTPRELMEQLKREMSNGQRTEQAPMDAATVKKLREQQMQQHMQEMQRLNPPPSR